MRATMRNSRTGLPFALGILAAVALPGCSTQQMQATTQVRTSNLSASSLKDAGIAFIIPSSVTGQEEDRETLALGFVEALRQARPELKVTPLATVLSAINKGGFAGEYRHMLEDYRLTGILDRETLQRIAAASGSRFVAQLKLAGFRQNSAGRWGFLGVRLIETRSANLRIFLQIWDSADGSIAWEGSQELTLAHESAQEDNVSFRNAVEESARQLVARLP